MESTYITPDGYALNYSIEGKGLATIVIGSHVYYPRTFSDNLKEHLQLIFLDQRAFAKRVNPDIPSEDGDFSLSKILDDIEGLRLELNLNKIILIGHSIHAFMALEYAKKYPDAVLKIILIAASPIAGPKLFEFADRYFNESVCPERKQALARNLSVTDDDQSFIGRMLKFTPMIWHDYSFDATHLWQGVDLDPKGAAIVWGSMFENYQITQNLEQIKCPIFLGLGRYDYWNPPHLWEPLRHLFKSLTVRIFEQSGHTPQLEEARLFDEELLLWLDLV